ncbi:MAG: hypothetical protein D3911_02060 [Candidatus Electrothrix sp. AW3_4]|nr:hypothetical protein [Candidatus Electrothrix gigas]
MLAWIKRNKEWLFSGIAVAVPLAIIGWVDFSNGDTFHQNNTGVSNVAGRDLTITTDTLNQQTHKGSGDNVSGDKNLSNDNSVHQRHSGRGDNVSGDKKVSIDNSQHQRHSGTGDNIGRDKIIKQYLLGSVDYKELVQEIKDAQELLAGIAPDKTALRLKQSAKVEEWPRCEM